MNIFIDKETNMFFGDEAKNRLETTNDKIFLNDIDGIIKVDEKRWKEAQYFERKIWIECIKDGYDDRNQEHMICFNNYDYLNSIDEKVDIIELGCGPFTNLRLILNKIRNVNTVELLDPLIMDYFHHHKNCTYKDGKLNGYNIHVISSSIEHYDFTKKYDIVVMVNVLEHCFDIDLIFKKIKDILKPNGIFIFGDSCIKDEIIQDLPNFLFDSGHPIRISNKKLEYYLEDYDRLLFNEYYDLHDQNWRIDKYYILKLK